MYTFVFSEYSTLFHVITCFAKIIALFFGYFTDFYCLCIVKHV